ncbi:unnamed protein product [Parajaminaea phylloscopi]
MPSIAPSSSSSSRAAAAGPLPALTSAQQALSATRFSSWYPPMRRVSPKATIVDVATLQPDFYEWLEEDGLMLPRGSGAGVVGGEEENDDDDDDDDDDGDGILEDDEDAAPPLQARDFSRLDEHIRAIIERYDGEVFPKMDWSAPRDAAWILPGQTLRCTTPADVYLLLKSSDFVAKDVEQAKEISLQQSSLQRGPPQQSGLPDMSDVQGQVASLRISDPPPGSLDASRATSGGPWQLNLILKRHFASLSPSHEFRCFVRAGRFVAACQRDGSTFYDFLQSPTVKLDIRSKLRDFWTTNLKNKLVIGRQGFDPSDANGEMVDVDNTLQDYVWDAYFTRDRSKLFLIDVNPYLPRTDALLWEWEELEDKADRAWRRAHGESIASRDEDDHPSNSRDDGDDVHGNAALFGDQDQRSDDGVSSDEEDRDPRGEAFVRIYTDGRPPTTHYEPWPASNDRPVQSGNGPRNAEQSRAGVSRPHQRDPLPTLRLLTSQMQAQHAMGGAPAYVANMAPKESVDVASDEGMQEFARAWRS